MSRHITHSQVSHSPSTWCYLGRAGIRSHRSNSVVFRVIKSVSVSEAVGMMDCYPQRGSLVLLLLVSCKRVGVGRYITGGGESGQGMTNNGTLRQRRRDPVQGRRNFENYQSSGEEANEVGQKTTW